MHLDWTTHACPSSRSSSLCGPPILPQAEVVNEMPLYPTETVLFDENQVPTVHYTGERAGRLRVGRAGGSLCKSKHRCN